MAGHRLYRSLMALKLLAYLVFPRFNKEAVPNRLVTPAGTEYDLYEPLSPARGVHILLYGMTYAGEKDRRLVNLASAYVTLGLRVAVPVLPGCKRFDFDIGDLEKLVDLIEVLHGQSMEPIRITGISTGGGLALVAAAQPPVSRKVDLLLLFSPHYSLMDVWQSLGKKTPPDPSDELKWEIFVWHQLALAYHFQDSLNLSQDETQEFMQILENYADSKPQAEEFYREVLADKEMPSFADISVDNAVLAELSPEGKIDDVRTRVVIFHDPYDERFAPVHSERIMSDLERRSGGCGQRLLITPLIAHSSTRFSKEILDVVPVTAMIGEIFAPNQWSVESETARS